jgi:MoaA/NifB/PqqE/SkfB family radical SAM enzyme
MAVLPLYHTWQRYRTLQTHRISALPIVILMPHSACNCRCIMCDIWKDNQNLKQLTEEDVAELLPALKKLGVRQVVMSGGEALLHSNFFRLCEILKKHNIKITLLSTGLLLKRHAVKIIEHIDEVIVSLDGDEQMHDAIRNIKGAYNKLTEGIQYLKTLQPGYKVTGRTVIHRLNFRDWPGIIDSAKKMGLQQISFLPADVSSHAFNREVLWSTSKQHELLLSIPELPEMMSIIDNIIKDYEEDLESGFIAESADKLKNIYTYYAASHGLVAFPFKKCNAPWVSTVVEADGTVRPCFFHEAIGNINTTPLDDILNSKSAIDFRKQLDTDKNEVCKKCVCYLNLSVRARV